MSTPSSTLRDEINAALGPKASVYWQTLNQYTSGKISRVEFEELVREAVDTPHLVQLHNSFIISIIGSSLHHAPPTPPPEAPGTSKPPRKRRQTIQGKALVNGDDSTEHEDGSLRSVRLKRWTVGVGKKERERIRNMEKSIPDKDRKPLSLRDEINQERGLALPLEAGAPPGSFPPVQLASTTRAPTAQHISERIHLISAQHHLPAPPSKAVTSLLMLAYEAKLKQLISQALALTSTSQTITSIQLSSPSSQNSSRILSTASFETLFTVRPAVLPNQSASVTKLISEGSGENRSYFDHETHFKERHTNDPRWQVLALLAERSTVRQELLASKS
ncbi:hypothetical protein SCHPADRAFT_921686 [Schizopora paradoxa]|uniref:Transcriptional regulator of RNA polII, SAGA, subunit-domain-containing protein n=1 Tax=Schizopora paradoxa TaxID=27342 RepID=A0A0H2RJ16_9AGAM|nr:hypothetical protein SCHPADRAFT_921686 [Schizopora paradoxa]